MKTPAWLGIIALGFALLITGGVWTSVFPGTSRWNLEKAARQSELKDHLHNLGYAVDAAAQRPSVHGGADAGPVIEEFKRLKTEFDALNADLQAAQDRPRTIVAVLKWSGISLALAGVIGWYVARNGE